MQAIVQPIGQADQIPVAPSAVDDKIQAMLTRKIKSTNVDRMNLRIIPLPRKIPSATNLMEITK